MGRPSSRVRKNAGRVSELVGGGLGRDGKSIGTAEIGKPENGTHGSEHVLERI